MQGCHFLGRVPANVKFVPEQVLEDGSYLAWIHPDGKSKKKGFCKILLYGILKKMRSVLLKVEPSSVTGERRKKNNPTVCWRLSVGVEGSLLTVGLFFLSPNASDIPR